MAHCTECQTEWTFKDKAGMYKTLDTSKNCPYCGEKQFVNLKSKQQGLMLNSLIIIAIIVPAFFNIPIIPHIISALVVIGVVLYLQITVIKLSSDEEFPV